MSSNGSHGQYKKTSMSEESLSVISSPEEGEEEEEGKKEVEEISNDSENVDGPFRHPRFVSPPLVAIRLHT